MKVELEDVLFWMDSIRNSEDRYQVLEAFWKGQIRSKLRLIRLLSDFEDLQDDPMDIVIHGGWFSVMSSLFFNSDIDINYIESVDKDPGCKEVSETINKRYLMSNEFSSVTQSMEDYNYSFDPDIVVNTTCEHVDDDTLQKWFFRIPSKTYVAVQSNDFEELNDHINCVYDADELANKFDLEVLKKDCFVTPKYNRFTVIGWKS